MAGVESVEVVVAHQECATLRAGDVFLKVDARQARSDREVEAMRLAPVPTPEILWRTPPVLALAALKGAPIAELGRPTAAAPAVWAAAGSVVRRLHEAPLPPWAGPTVEELTAELDAECEWLLANDVLPAELVRHNRERAAVALRPWRPAFVHGDLQVAHVFADGAEITGVIDWTEAAPGDAHVDLAILTLGHREHLDDVLAGYGTDVDRDTIRGWWSFRCLRAIRWLVEHGFDPFEPGAEVDVLKAQ